MEKKIYIKPLTDIAEMAVINAYLAGDNSIPGGGEGGPGIAEGKERNDFEKETDTWGNLW